MALALHVTRYNLRAFARNKRARVFTVVLPLVLLVFLAGVFDGGRTTVNGVHVDYAEFFVPSVVIFTLTTTTLAMLVASVVSQRELGVLKRRRATPLPAWALIASQSLTVLLMALGSVALLLAVAAVGFDVGVPLRGVPTLLAGVLFGAASFCGLGYALSTFADSADAAQPLIQMILFPLFFISGVWVPVAELPGWLGTIAAVFPVEHVADLVHRAFVGVVPAGAVIGDIAVLSLWAVGGAVVASRRFAWLPPR